MNKKIGVIIPLLSISAVFVLGYNGFGWKEQFFNKKTDTTIAPITPLIDVSAISNIPVDALNTHQTVSNTPRSAAWQVFQDYLSFAHTHNLPGIKSLSYQMSATCLDQAKEKECFSLMDGVYSIGSSFKAEDFKNVLFDERQLILFTDVKDQARTALYFVKDESGALKILGLRFCLQEEGEPDTCVAVDEKERDKDGNGWWDNVESLFY